MKRCPKCHRTYTDDSLNFCLTDGEALVNDAGSLNSQTTAIYSQPKSKSKGRTLRLIAIAVMLVLGLSAGSYFFFFGSQTKSSGNETNQNGVRANTQSPPQPSPSIAQTPEETAATIPTPSQSPITAESPSASPEASATPVATPSGQNTKSKIESQFFTFDLKQCKLSGAAVACDLLITNNDRDRRLNIRGSSTIFDQEGNQYRAGKMQLANHEDSYSVSSYLISGVATKARVMFDAVSPTATKLTLLHLNFSVEGSPDFNIQYRNVPLK